MTESDRTRAREERLRRAAARRGQPRGFDRPAWRTLARGFEEGYAADEPTPGQVERWRPRDRYADRNTDAEYAFYRLPGRFQTYAAEYLFASERILAFVPWTAEVTESWWTRASRLLAPAGRQAREGALVVTDRQVLLLRDDEEPVGGMLFWGYTAHATTQERLAAVATRQDARGRVYLRLYLAARGGGEIVEWVFPADTADAIRDAAVLLREFLPRGPGGGDIRLRRQRGIIPADQLAVVPKPPLPGRRRAALEAEVAPHDRAALEALLAEVLATVPGPDGRPRRVHAAAIAPATRIDGGPRLVALTQAHVMVVTLPDQGTPMVCPVAAVTSAELRHSPLGYHVAWTLAGRSPWAAAGGRRARTVDGAPDRPRRITVTFPLPAYAHFFRLFAALRQALALLPVAANGIDLPVGPGGPGEDELRRAGAGGAAPAATAGALVA